MSTTKIILILTNLPILLVAIYAKYYYSQFNKVLRVFTGFLFLSVIIQTISVTLYLFGVNNMPLLHLYTLLGGFIIIQFYRLVLINFIPPHVLNYTAWFFAGFVVLDSLLLENILTFNTIALTVEAVLVVILALTTFNIFLNDETEFKNQQVVKGLNWINSGFFIYFTSNILLYYFGDRLVQPSVSTSIFNEVWLLHSLFSTTMYLFFFIGLWKVLKK